MIWIPGNEDKGTSPKVAKKSFAEIDCKGGMACTGVFLKNGVETDCGFKHPAGWVKQSKVSKQSMSLDSMMPQVLFAGSECCQS